LDFVHTDRRIADRLLRGDEAAFDALFESFFPRLYRFALSRVAGDGEEARELVQQTFCKAFERLDSYRGEASLYGWMCQILRNVLIDRARRRRTEGRYIVPADDDAVARPLVETLRSPASGEPEHALTRLDLLQLIQATLDYLPSHYGDVLELKYIDGLTVREIAQRLAIGPKATESLLTRARGAFREAIVAISDSADLLPGELRPHEERNTT
jgi:RNA polymerase sigma-70 factor (ECF subfamily)